MSASILTAILVSAAVRGAEDPVLVRGPSWVEGCLSYYGGFEGDPGRPDLNPAKIEVASLPAPRMPAPPGLFGRGLDTGALPLVLHGPALSPHRPVTVSFWWTLPKDLPVDGSFNLFQFTGRGIISAFVKGKGEWCALREPAGVLQVYYFPGIGNVNGIYDAELSKHLDLRAGAWHHTAVVIRRASLVELYTDGKRVAEITTSGRRFLPGDKLETLQLGGGVILDELIVLDRAIDPEGVADYHRGARRLREYTRVERTD